MQFLYPIFLWSLLALIIPVIIHLFYFRRFKKIDFTNVRFLKEIKEETSHRSRIRNLLVLLSRILAFAALIFAFAYPFLKDSSDTIIGRKASSIFIDNSFSMQSKAEDVTLLERARSTARQIIESHNDDDIIQIITQDLEGGHQRWRSKEDALGSLDEIVVSSASRSISTILQRQRQMFSQAENHSHHIYWLSDFQEAMFDIDKIEDTSLHVSLLPFQSVQENNISIDSVWLEAPVAQVNEENMVQIKVSNHGSGSVDNVRLSVLYNDQTKPLKVINLKAGETKTDTFSISVKGSGWQSAQFQITDHPITFDDKFYISFDVPGHLQVLIVAEHIPNDHLSMALRSMKDLNLDIVKSSAVDYNKFSQYDMIILDALTDVTSGLSSELSKYQETGGNNLLFPSPNGNLNSYNSFFSALGGPVFSKNNVVNREVSRINADEFIFNSVFFKISKNIRLPVTLLSFGFERTGSGNSEKLLRYRDGGLFLGKFSKGEGRLFVCGSPLDTKYNSLSKNAEIFIPMLHKMALSRSTQSKNSYTIGRDEIVTIPDNGDNVESIYEIKGDKNFIPGASRIGKKVLLTTEGQIVKDGVYQLMSGKKEQRKLAYNYDRSESKMSFIDVDDSFAKSLSDQTNLISSKNQTQLATFLKEEREGKSYWRTLLILSLIFLGIEQILLRFWKI